MTNNSRVPGGVPTGGQFSSRQRAEATVTLEPGRAQPGDYIENDAVTHSLARFPELDTNATTGLTDSEFNQVTDHYLVAALWTSEEDGDDSDDESPYRLDGSQSIYDFAPEARARAQADLTKFLTDSRLLLDQARSTGYGEASGDESGFLGQVGHDFWLTRNHHGVGFWDRPELDQDGLGRKLSAAATRLGEVTIEAGDDGMVYFL